MMDGANTTFSKKRNKPLCRICLRKMQAEQGVTPKVLRVPSLKRKTAEKPMATTVMTSKHRYIKSQVDSIVLKAARMPSTVSVYRLNDAGERVLIRTESASRR